MMPVQSQATTPIFAILQQRFRYANVGPVEKSEIERLYYITSHLNVGNVMDENGKQVLKDWKYFMSSETRELE